MRLSERITPDDGELKSVVEEVLTYIDTVHHVSDLPPVFVHYTNSFSSFARYVPGDGRPEHIELSRFGPHTQLSFVHEVGHLLDHALGQFAEYASQMQNSPLQNVLKVATRTLAVTQLRSGTQSGTVLEAGANRYQLLYWLAPVEIWARAYAQYIASRGNNDVLLKELTFSRERETLHIYRNVQWEAGDFAPIASAIETAFRKLGWQP